MICNSDRHYPKKNQSDQHHLHRQSSAFRNSHRPHLASTILGEILQIPPHLVCNQLVQSAIVCTRWIVQGPVATRGYIPLAAADLAGEATKGPKSRTTREVLSRQVAVGFRLQRMLGLLRETPGSWCGIRGSWLGILLWHQPAASSSPLRASGGRGAPRTPAPLRRLSQRRTSSALSKPLGPSCLEWQW